MHSRIDGGSDRSAKGIPTAMIEPVEKFGPSVVSEVLRGSHIEPWVELMNNGTILIYGVAPNVISTCAEINQKQSLETEP